LNADLDVHAHQSLIGRQVRKIRLRIRAVVVILAPYHFGSQVVVPSLHADRLDLDNWGQAASNGMAFYKAVPVLVNFSVFPE
jgi:hypothetical protein